MKNFCLNCNKDNYTYVKKRKGKLIEVCTKCNNEINTYCEECKENTKNIIDYLSTGGYQIICEKCHQIKKVDKYKPKNDTQKINTKETDDTPYETPESLAKRREALLKDKQTYTPKCPTCGSPDIVRISSITKATNIALFGLLGNRRKKTFHCNNCKYEW